MSRKEPSFGALMDYIDRELGQEETRIRHNLLGRGRDRIRDEFEGNAGLLQKRKNGVYLYHEIISLTRAKGIPAKEQHALLHDIVQQYIAARCPDNLCYGGIHQDKDHSYHFHLMISANRAGDQKRHRLSKAQFRDIQVKLEAHVLEHYPQLEQKLAIGKRSERKRSRGDIEHERRTGRPPSRKEALQGRLRAAYGAADSREALLAALAAQGFRHAPRGTTFARVIDEYTGKAHRLATLDAELAGPIEKRLKEPERQDTRAQQADRAAASGGSAGEKEKGGADQATMSREEARAQADAERQAWEKAENAAAEVQARKAEDAARQAWEAHERDEAKAQATQAPPDAGLSAQQRAWKREAEERRTEREARRRDDPERER